MIDALFLIVLVYGGMFIILCRVLVNAVVCINKQARQIKDLLRWRRGFIKTGKKSINKRGE